MIGDGYTVVFHCPNSLAYLENDCYEPEAEPVYCDFEEDKLTIAALRKCSKLLGE